MEKYELIQKEVKDQIEALPVFYKKMQYSVTREKESYFMSSNIYTRSIRHKTNSLVSSRYYKQITLLEI